MFLRNNSDLTEKKYHKDFIINAVNKIFKKKKIKLNILEIGCGNGSRLSILSKNKKLKCYGIDPSKLALKSNKNKKIKLKNGTADYLPYQEKKFDIIIFSFCLYLCDDYSLFKIINETIRVSKNPSHIIIYDFFYKGVKYLNYIHNKKIKVRKMDYSKLFIWHPKMNLIEKRKIYEKSNIRFQRKSLNCTALQVIKKDF